MSDITQLIFSAVAALLALSIHEFSHAFAAYKLGDPTAKSLGRLTINPIKHIDPFGAICMIFFHFGWAKPVPINARYFKKPRRDFALTALAGPLSNILFGFILSLVYLICLNTFRYTDSQFLNNLINNTVYFIFILFSLNVGLGIFNLIPIPPFDGSRIVNVILPPKWYFKIMRYERYIYWGVIAWLLIGNYFYAGLMSIGFIAANPVLAGIARIFSLSGMISDAISFLSGAMLKFWALLPFLDYPF